MASTHEDRLTVHQMPESATVFTVTQLNEALDAMPLRVVPVNDILDPAAKIDRMSIVMWRGEMAVNARVEPVSCRNGLFSSNKTYWLVGRTVAMGRSIFNCMVAHDAQHVVYTSRNPKVDDQWVEYRRLLGARVVYIKSNASRRDDVHDIFKQFKLLCHQLQA